MLVLFTDTDCDITPQVAQHYGYKLISMPYIVDGKETRPYEDFQTFNAHEFYQQLRDGVLPQTCALSPADYVAYFEPYFANGDDILYVHFSSAMSGTFNAMNLAIAELKQKYTKTKFYTIDTKAITILSCLIAKEVGEMYLRGCTAEQMVEWAKEQVDHYAVFFYADNLKFFAKSGRVSNLTATMGNLLGIHPILHMDTNGTMQTLTKGQGSTGTLKKIVAYVEEYQENIASHPVIIGHADCLPLAQKLANMLKQKFGQDLPIEFVDVNPTAGSHCGPDTTGVAFHAKRRHS
ncbi:MAG: DegV family protein [Clostridia bacterium]|nr:DegV family protein [Clostridia bacterium]